MPNKIRFGWISILLLIGCSMGLAQTDSDRPVADLIGGSIRSELTVSGSIALWRGIDGFSDNPAGLGMFQKRKVVFEWTPGLSQNLDTWIHADRKIREKMDGLIRDRGTRESRVDYPSFSAMAGFRLNPADFQAAIPFRIFGRHCGVGLGYSVPVSMDISFVGTGMEVGIDTEQEIQGEIKRVRMRARSGANGLFQLRMQRVRFEAGADLGEGTWIGGSLIRSRLSAKASARVNPDCILEISGTEYLFNDPYDPRIDFRAGEQNDIRQAFDADYSGSGWGFRLGAVKSLTRTLQVGISFDFPSKICMSGKDSLVNNRIPFIRIEEGQSGGNIDELIDPARIDLASLTQTERILKKNQYEPVLTLPKVFCFAAQWKRERIRITLGYIIYSGVFSIASKNEELGIRLRQGANLETDFYYVFLGGSVDFANGLKKDGETGRALILPRAHLGFRIPLSSSFRMEGLIGAEPAPALRVTGRYEF